MWTVQEITIPPLQDVTIYWGDVTLPLAYLFFFVRCFVKDPIFTCNKIRNAMELQELILDEFIALQRGEPVTLESFAALPALNFAHILRTHRGTPSRNPKITPILAKARFKLSTDPKDKVFALHGIFDNIDIEIAPPDYTKSIEDIYTEAKVVAIKTDKNIDILLQCSSEVRNARLPSWVPDYSVSGFLLEDPRDPSAGFSKFFPNFNATRNVVPHWEFPEPNKIVVRGKILDSIASRLPSSSPYTVFSILKDIDKKAVDPSSSTLNELHGIFEVLQSWVQSCAGHTVYANGEPLQTALYRTLLDDRNAMNKVAEGDNAFASWYRIVTTSEMERLEIFFDLSEQKKLDKKLTSVDETHHFSAWKNLVGVNAAFGSI
jgi:hypothetical protein